MEDIKEIISKKLKCYIQFRNTDGPFPFGDDTSWCHILRKYGPLFKLESWGQVKWVHIDMILVIHSAYKPFGEKENETRGFIQKLRRIF